MQNQLPFPAVRFRPRMPQEPIVRSAEIEDNYRWTLRRAWGAGPCILWCGLNPSTADARRDDPTMLREMGFSFRLGFGSLVKVNIYPFIAANQAALRTWRASFDGEDRSARDAWLHNMDVVNKELTNAQTVVAAWGNGVDGEDLDNFLEEVCEVNFSGPAGAQLTVDWMCLGKNENGSPKHTLARGAYRVPDDTVLQPWRST